MKYIRYLSAYLLFVFPGTLFAASLDVLPRSSEISSGESITVSVSAKTAGEKICVLGGSVILNNLACQSVSVTDGLMTQTAPTCANLKFLIGIPGCSTSDKILFSMKVKAVNTGPGSFNFSGVKIIGEGISLGNGASGGSYSIKALNSTPKTVLQAPETVKNSTSITTGTTTTSVPKKKTLFDVNIGSTSSSRNNYLLPISIFLGVLFGIAVETIFFLTHKIKTKKHVV